MATNSDVLKRILEKEGYSIFSNIDSLEFLMNDMKIEVKDDLTAYEVLVEGQVVSVCYDETEVMAVIESYK